MANFLFIAATTLVPLRDPAVSELSRLGYGRVRSVTPLNSGGSDRGLRTTHRRYDTDEGPVFCKTSQAEVAGAAFSAEAASLRALRTATLGAGLLRAPKPIAHGELQLGGAYRLRSRTETGPAERRVKRGTPCHYSAVRLIDPTLWRG